MKKLLLTSLLATATCFTVAGTASAVTDHNSTSERMSQHQPHHSDMQERSGGPLAELDLTEAQQTKIKEIRDSYRAQGRDGHEQARAAIEQVLTAEQRAQLEQMKAEHEARGGRHGGHGEGERRGGDHNHERRGGPLAELDLTQAQQAQVKEIRDSYRGQGRDGHEQARTAIEQVLTAEQRAELEQMKAEHEAGGRPHR